MPERTEAPTPHRIAEARRKGQVARSVEVNTALLLVTGFWMMGPMTRRLASELGTLTRECLTCLWLAKRRGSELAETRTLQARLSQQMPGDPQPCRSNYRQL